MFGFEKGIDITNDKQVLFRRNVVIKNIIFLSNLIYTLIFTIMSIGDSSNWVITIICFPLTFFINVALKKMIFKNSNDYIKQQIAMYMACFYMFLTAILIYFKLKFGSQSYLGEVGYILIYYALVVVSLYQDKKMLKVVCQWVLIIVTILHFTITYDIVNAEYATDLRAFITNFFVSIEFRDIILRTIILILFMVVLYCIVAIGGAIQEERKTELAKRRQVQSDFTKVVTEIFDVTLNNNNRSEEEVKQVELIAIMAKRLSSIYGETPKQCDDIYNYSKIHVEKMVSFNDNVDIYDDKNFELLKEQTNLGSIIIRRLQLERKTQDIIRAHMEGSNTDEFVHRMKNIQNNIESQIIMLCDMYVTLRSLRSYKRAYNHKVSMEYLEDHFKIYFDSLVFDRFVRFQNDFEKLYDEF